jgi:hypothetical protein
MAPKFLKVTKAISLSGMGKLMEGLCQPHPIGIGWSGKILFIRRQ